MTNTTLKQFAVVREDVLMQGARHLRNGFLADNPERFRLIQRCALERPS